jgi:hypothetical protein
MHRRRTLERFDAAGEPHLRAPKRPMRHCPD